LLDPTFTGGFDRVVTDGTIIWQYVVFATEAGEACVYAERRLSDGTYPLTGAFPDDFTAEPAGPDFNAEENLTERV
jgi:hypothetical protein